MSALKYDLNKPRVDLVPPHIWLLMLRKDAVTGGGRVCLSAVEALTDWWHGDDGAFEPFFAERTASDMLAMTQVLEFGAEKYDSWNWLKGMLFSKIHASLIRHSLAVVSEDEMLDPESGLPHFAHVMCNCMFLNEYTNLYGGGELDDRPRPAL